MEKWNVLYLLNEAEELGGTSLSLENLLHSVSGRVRPVLLFRAPGPVADYFRQKGYECLIVPFRLDYISGHGWFRNLTYPLRVLKNRLIRARAARKVCKLLENRKIDLVHTNTSVIDLGRLVARRLQVPHIWHLREFIDLGLHIRPIGGLARWRRQVLGADAVIAISRQLYDHLDLAGHPNCHLLQDAVAPASVRCCEPVKEPYFVFLAGRIHPIKSPETAIEVFCRSGLAREGYRLKMTGRCTPEYREQLLRQSTQWGGPEGIVFQDFTHDVRDLLSHAAGFLLTSRFEGLGRVMIEAMFYGCPVIAYASGPAADILTDGQTGFLFQDAATGAQRLRQAVETDCSQLLRQAGDLAVADYSEENYGGKLCRIYENVLKPQQP